jgi:hypothetical protein
MIKKYFVSEESLVSIVMGYGLESRGSNPAILLSHGYRGLFLRE